MVAITSPAIMVLAVAPGAQCTLGVSPVWSRARGGLIALQVFVVSLRGYSLTVVIKDVSQSDRKIRVLVICKVQNSNENQEMYAYGTRQRSTLEGTDRRVVEVSTVSLPSAHHESVVPRSSS